MSSIPDALPAYPASPPRPPAPPPPPPRPILGCAFALSFLLNIVCGVLILLLCVGLFAFRGGIAEETSSTVPEKYHSGSRTASDKVAIVAVDGIIMEGLLGYATKQIDQAAKDNHVKAVVLRINSPGGSITASDDLYRRILRLRDGDKDKETNAKPLIVSMGSVAASGGYYIAVPASKIFAEETTTTGSVGVYGTFPNVEELGNKIGVSVKTIKAGKIKDAGSYFKKISPEEQQVLQDMVDDAYVRFLQVVETGRKPKLTRKKLLERFTVTPLRPDPLVAPDAKPYQRYRADGGGYTAAKAKELDLIDAIGTLDDAIKAAAVAAELGSYRAIEYQKQRTLSEMLLGVRTTPTPIGLLDADRLQSALSPRMWYLAPGYEAAGVLAASDRAR